MSTEYRITIRVVITIRANFTHFCYSGYIWGYKFSLVFVVGR